MTTSGVTQSKINLTAPTELVIMQKQSIIGSLEVDRSVTFVALGSNLSDYSLVRGTVVFKYVKIRFIERD